MSKGKDDNMFKHMVYAKLAGAEWVRTSVRASGSTMRAMRKAEGENAANARIYNAASPTRKRPRRDKSADTSTTSAVISMKTVVMKKELLCAVCAAPTPSLFLTHAANPYWLVCDHCIKA
jgi:hypothetical protein